MGVTATINHNINADIAEYLVQEFGHNPIKEQKAEEIIKKLKMLNLKTLKPTSYCYCNGSCRSWKNICSLDTLRKTNVIR